MITGDIRNQIDRIWDSFWSGGISNPIEVIEQVTYLLFIRRLDDLHTLEENKANRLKKPMERRIFPAGKPWKLVSDLPNFINSWGQRGWWPPWKLGRRRTRRSRGASRAGWRFGAESPAIPTGSGQL